MTTQHTPTWPEVCALLAQFQQAQFPGTMTIEVALHLAGGKVLTLPFVLGVLRAASVTEPVFLPTAYQNAVLAALEGKFMRTDALAGKVGDRSRLFRNPGGLKELQEQGLVSHHPRRGYYRPDAPPVELAELRPPEPEGVPPGPEEWTEADP